MSDKPQQLSLLDLDVERVVQLKPTKPQEATAEELKAELCASLAAVITVMDKCREAGFIPEFLIDRDERVVDATYHVAELDLWKKF